jgi:RNA polymerase sigma-70 factor (ECF subfamily)
VEGDKGMATDDQVIHESDAELIAQYRRGDLNSMQKLVHRHRVPLFGYIVNMTGKRDVADDVFQEVWIRAIRKLDTYKMDNFPGWLMRIARNFVIDESRKKKPQLSLDYETEDGQSLQQILPGKVATPDRMVADGELGSRIADAVQALPPEQKEVFILRVKADMPFKEICKIQGTSINTALARMQYALTRLRTLLKDEYAQLEGAI